jgi:hypothetical protein
MKDCGGEAEKKEKSVLSDKAFLQSVSVSVFGIVLCMISLCSASWAWFSTSLSSPSNNIQAATCEITVTVKEERGEVDAIDGKYALMSGCDYLVTIKAEGSAKQTYCILVIDGNKYYTEQIYTAEPDNEISFILRFDKKKTVEVINRWGISSRSERDIYDGKEYLNMAEVAQEGAEVEENEQGVIN